MNFFTRHGRLALTLLCCLFMCANVNADLARDLQHLEQRWAEVNYQLQGKTRLAAFDQLIGDADTVVREHPDSADALIWRGVIKASYASAKGWFWGLGPVRRARADLEAALLLDANAMRGAAYANLGALYFRALLWPLGFGNDRKAEEFLQQALALDPDGIDSNYFYGSFLIQQKRYEEARHYLLKAQQAPARPGHLLADNGRQDEIRAALAAIPDR